MEVTFGTNETKTPVIDVAAEKVGESAPTQQAPANITVPAVIGGNGFLVEDNLPGFQDIILPRINIVQGVGLLRILFLRGPLFTGRILSCSLCRLSTKPAAMLNSPRCRPFG